VSYLTGLRRDLGRIPGAGLDLLIIAATAAAALVAGQYHAGPLAGRILAGLLRLEDVDPVLASGWLQLAGKLCRAALLVVPPSAVILLLRIPRRDLGIGSGRPGTWLRDIAILYAVVLPFIWWAARQPGFRQVYPYFSIARLGGGWFAIGLAARLVYMFAWEFLFRGYLLFGFERRIGPAGAVAASTIPFVLMHFGKPAAETYSSIVAGIVLGVVALRARSFIPAALLHFAVAATLDVAAVAMA